MRGSCAVVTHCNDRPSDGTKSQSGGWPNVPQQRTTNLRLDPVAITRQPSSLAFGLVCGIAALSAAALVNRYLANKAERDNPPRGRFVNVGGVKLHYLDKGAGEPLILLHGNGSMVQDFQSSGLIAMASRKYRVIAFDRPGFGHSARPRGTIWTPNAQADLVHRALNQLGIERAHVLGHSWGASVAVALASKYPDSVAGLILASGYYYPTLRSDVFLLSGPSFPVVGDIVSHTIAPLLSRLLWPVFMRQLFGPALVPGKFREFPKEMAHRPVQIRASAAETALMIPCALQQRAKYRELNIPTVIIAGEQDRLIDIDEQSARLHREVKRSMLLRVAGAGHMVHQTATTQVMEAIDAAMPSLVISDTRRGRSAAESASTQSASTRGLY
jgi:pimeloyl-ACP methyl ester carboxylesterase